MSNQLCFLFYRVERSIMAAYRTLLKPLGITYLHYITLLVLWEKGKTTVGGLCTALHLDTGTLSPLLKRMEKNGLILRKRSQADERSVEIELTEAGSNLEEKAVFIPNSLLEHSGMDKETYMDLSVRLRKLLEIMERKT